MDFLTPWELTLQWLRLSAWIHRETAQTKYQANKSGTRPKPTPTCLFLRPYKEGELPIYNQYPSRCRATGTSELLDQQSLPIRVWLEVFAEVKTLSVHMYQMIQDRRMYSMRAVPHIFCSAVYSAILVRCSNAIIPAELLTWAFMSSCPLNSTETRF